jgi:uncharacterized membrane protein
LTARIRKFLNDLGDTFWLVPGLMVLAGVLGGIGLVQLEQRGDIIPQWMLDEAWLYNGGATGARTLLGAVASSTIAVAGTVFSITIAALSLAAGQMGPRLLRNFTRDRGNQFTLGAFLGTFAFSLMVLRAVRTETEGEFIPHIALTVAILMALVCVATLVWFVGHMAGRINVDTVIDLVIADVHEAIERLTTEDELPPPPPASFWNKAQPVPDYRYGYLQQLDENGLADWAAEHGTAIRLLVRPGHYVFPGAPIALVNPPGKGAEDAILAATALGPQRNSPADVEFAVRHLVEVAVRALSPGVNDPRTAISVLDRLGTALCQMVPRRLPTGVVLRDDKPVLLIPAVDYDGLVAAMFHMIRQNAASQPSVLIRILEVLTTVVSCEPEAGRVATLQRHADLVLADAERGQLAPADLEDVRGRHRTFEAMREGGPLAALSEADEKRS